MSSVLKLNRFRPEGIPALLVAGLPGSGKTHLIREFEAANPTLVVHHIDAALWEDAPDEGGEVVFQEWLEGEIRAVVEQREADYLAIELPFEADVRMVAEGFVEGGALTGVAWLDAVVSVVDGVSLLDRVGRWESAPHLPGPDPDSEAYEQTGVLVDQLEFCDALYVRGAERLTPGGRHRLEEALRSIQSRARVLFSPLGEEEGRRLAYSRLFDERETCQGALRVQALLDCLEEFDPPLQSFDSLPYFVYRRRRPFHPGRLWAFLHEYPEGIFRSHGALWIATEQDLAFGLDQFGMDFLDLTPDGAWIDAMDDVSKRWFWEHHGESVYFWDDTSGDRYTELVFIGREFDREELVRRMDGCLVTEEEFQGDWGLLPNPIPGMEEFPVRAKAPSLRLVHTDGRPVPPT